MSGTPFRTGRWADSLHAFCLAAAVLIGPGALLLSGYDRWDGAEPRYIIESRHLDGLGPLLLDGAFVIFWALTHAYARVLYWLGTDYWVTSRVLLAALLAGIGWQTGRLAMELFGFDRRSACWVAALCLAFPGQVLYHASCHLGYGLFTLLGLWGYRLALQGGAARSAAGYALALVAMQMNSNLVFLPMLEVVRWVLRGGADRQGLRRFGVLLAIAVASYVCYRKVAGIHGQYALVAYNELRWPTSPANAKRLLQALAAWSTWLLLPAAGVALVLVLKALKVPVAGGSPGTPPAAPQRALAAALVLCAAAVAAYAAVGKYAAFIIPTALAPAGSVYASFMREFGNGPFFSGLTPPPVRHTVLLGPSLAIATVALCRWLSTRRALAGTAVALLAACWLHQAGWSAWAHKEKLVQGALDVSVVNGLRAVQPPAAGTWVTLERHQRQKTWYDPLETNMQLWDAFGSAAYMGATVYAPSGPSHEEAVRQRDSYRELFARPDAQPYKDAYIASDFVDAGLHRYYVVEPAEPGWADLLWRAPFAPRNVAPARVTCTSGCQGDSSRL